MATREPRGIRNNNPGNLRISGDQWLGLSATQTDNDFFQFISPYYGIRAMAKTLRTYYQKHDLKTIEKIIHRYAPTSENKTDSYVKSVVAQVGKDANARLNIVSDWPALVRAIIYHENGKQPYSDDLINAAIGEALGIV